MSYAISGKIAGLGSSRRSFRGFGDASSDYASALAAYQADHAAWLKEKTAHDNAILGNAAQSAGAASSYASALASWNAASAARAAQVAAAQRQQLAIQVAASRATTAARAAGVVTPPDYPGCVSQAQHSSWQAACAAISTTVKGLGADPTGPFCALALLPVCQPPVAMPPPLPPPPTLPSVQLTPVPALRPEPQPPAPPPVATTAPAPSPLPQATPFQNSPLGPAPISVIDPGSSSSPTPITPPPSKSAGLIKNGLILVVLAGGGYALYRTFRKPRAA